MKSLIDTITESYTDGVLDKSVKSPEIKKIKNSIYKFLDKTKTTEHQYHDSAWEGVCLVRNDVQDALDRLSEKRNDGYTYELSIAPDDGGYRTSRDGMSQSKVYKVEIYKVHIDYRADEEYPNPFIIGTLTCHAAGTVGDPWKAYDMSFLI